MHLLWAESNNINKCSWTELCYHWLSCHLDYIIRTISKTSWTTLTASNLCHVLTLSLQVVLVLYDQCSTRLKSVLRPPSQLVFPDFVNMTRHESVRTWIKMAYAVCPTLTVLPAKILINHQIVRYDCGTQGTLFSNKPKFLGLSENREPGVPDS